MENCQVCGYTFNPAHRRRLEHLGESVEYCADNAECGEAAAMEYLEKVAAAKIIGDGERTELQEAGHVNLGPASIGAVMVMLEDLGIDPFEAQMPNGTVIKVEAV